MARTYAVKLGNATLYFEGNSGSEEADLLNLENCLRNACGTYGNSWDSVASYLIKSYTGFKVATRPYHDYVFNYKLELTYTNYQYSVRVTDKQGIEKFNGYLVGFSNKLKTFNWHDHKGKVVRFTYEGGTNPGDVRLVKVKTFENGNIYTNDLIKGDARTFSVSNIKNPELVQI